MSHSRTVISAVAAWLVVVILGSTLVWAVISRAGDGIAPTVGPGVTDSVTGPSRSPGSPTTPSSDATGGPERRSWQGAGGVVTAQCRGERISVVASADPGFVVERESRGLDEVRVSFQGQGDEGRETEVRARCVDGVPDFEVDARDD
ncbi:MULTISPECIES: hypothetical protein [unclassified Nocardioides]|uniref:hypothetical protein n=1 Tax=unclassified Nocardioides TaxID=2615069 RepID=UPI0009F0C9A2|nr:MULTISPECIES: hypothetical protein [unclassified Nocardioides]GAW49059.1 uncharacterized protein (Precursor) [Nocardioides sp. PD653-B2]GAW53215.1 uncharacterized protein (Precursor) [Nocardioides sp. PD653]